MASSNNLPCVTYGFIGIGVMGWGMAQNLRAKIPESSILIICELVQARRDQFIAQTQGLLRVAMTPKEVAEQAVSVIIEVYV
jgi:3-hydroxyisobutyrate dehydrogenase-like beta-hydroxyacid dehydrogenase